MECRCSAESTKSDVSASYSTVATMLLLDVNVESDCNASCLAPTLYFLLHLFMPCTPPCVLRLQHIVCPSNRDHNTALMLAMYKRNLLK